MMKTIHSIVILLFLLVLNGCERRQLEERVGAVALVPLHIDWGQSRLNVADIYQASVWFYPHDGGEPFEFRMQESVTDAVIPLAVGKYSIIVFNETVDLSDWASLLFYGMDSYQTFYVTTADDSFTGLYTRNTDEKVRKAPDAIASWSIDEFEVTPDMVAAIRSGIRSSSPDVQAKLNEQLDKLANITPLPLTKEIAVRAYVKNLNNAVRCSGVLKGATSGVLLASRKAIEDRVTHIFIMNNREYDDPNNAVDGYIHSPQSFHVFGFTPPEEKRELQLDFQLVDGTKAPSETFDITEQMNKDIEKTEVEVGLKMAEGDEDDHPIVLPEKGVGGDVGVDDWEDMEIPVL